MVRLHFVVEGQTEEEFVNSVLVDHLGLFNVVADVRCVETSRQRARFYRGGLTVQPRIFRGGLCSYERAKRDLHLWMAEDQNIDARFTTMFDLYALPNDFPTFDEAARKTDPYDRVASLERALASDISDWRFVPYIQLHEFETLLLADPAHLRSEFPDHESAVRRLVALVPPGKNPEEINDGTETAPSKRISKHIAEYEGRKSSAGPLVAGKVGLPTLRARCRHFGEWLGALERLGGNR
jgi:hypothetical protein